MNNLIKQPPRNKVKEEGLTAQAVLANLGILHMSTEKRILVPTAEAQVQQEKFFSQAQTDSAQSNQFIDRREWP